MSHFQMNSIMKEQSITKIVVKMGFPATISVIVLSFGNLLDTLFVAKHGEQAVAAVGVLLPVLTLIQTMGYVIGMGGASIIAAALGKEDAETTQKTIISSILLTVLVGVIFVITGMLINDSILELLGARKSTAHFGLPYGRIILYGAPLMIATFVLTNLLRALQRPILSMLLLFLSVALNLGFNLLFWGLHKGILGVGYAFVIGYSGAMLLGIGFLIWVLRKSNLLHFPKKMLVDSVKMLPQLIKLGLPSLFRQGTGSVAVFAQNKICSGISQTLVAAMSIVGKEFLLFFAVAIGLSQGYQPIVGYYYGAGKKKKTRQALSVTLLMGTVLLLAAATLLYYFATDLAGILAKQKEVQVIAAKGLQIASFSLPFTLLSNMTNMTFQAIKSPAKASFIAMLRQGILYLPLLFLLGSWRGMNGVLYAQPLADVLTFAACIPFLLNYLKKQKT